MVSLHHVSSDRIRHVTSDLIRASQTIVALGVGKWCLIELQVRLDMRW
jgi:hypothetical protein